MKNYKVYVYVSVPIIVEAADEGAARLTAHSRKLVPADFVDKATGETWQALRVGNIIEWDEPVVEPVVEPAPAPEPEQPKQERTIKRPPLPNPHPQGEWVEYGGMYDRRVWHLGRYTLDVSKLPGVKYGGSGVYNYEITRLRDEVTKIMDRIARPSLGHESWGYLTTLELAQAAAESHLFLLDGAQDDLVEVEPEEIDCEVCAGEGYWEEEGRMVMCQVCRGKGFLPPAPSPSASNR